MAGTSLLALIDDIASTLDDVAAMTKVATKKTAGVLGDDLALNAQQVAGVKADRELAVVWAVAKGSSLNKAILVPLALGISAFLPWLITPLLMAGGLFLCFEGFEKIFEKILHWLKKEVAHVAGPQSHVLMSPEQEKEKIKGAVRTDFILSAEIIVITLGTMAGVTFKNQFLTLLIISIIMTVGVYGLVAMIVKLDDVGAHLAQSQRTLIAGFGKSILVGAPYLMKFLGIAGTIAMFLVGGGILTHGIPALHHWKESLDSLSGMGVDLIVGLAAGGICLLALAFFKTLARKRKQ